VYKGVQGRISKALPKMPLWGKASHILSRVQMNKRITLAFSKVWRRTQKRKREDLGKVVSFATQEVKGFSAQERYEGKVMDNDDPENESGSNNAVQAIEL
jgi:hypothetical protein